LANNVFYSSANLLPKKKIENDLELKTCNITVGVPKDGPRSHRFHHKSPIFFDQKRFPEPFGLSAEKKIEKKLFQKVVGYWWVHPHITKYF
jgi:hypothetical protein